MRNWVKLVVSSVLVASMTLAVPVQAAPRLFESFFDRLNGSNERLPTTGPRTRVPAIYQRQQVRLNSAEAPGTIIVDTSDHFLYLVLGDGRALRYGIGVARDGFEWSGTHRVTRKAEWPGWTPPAEMRRRQPGLPAYMPGGPTNPLGARALYLGSTLYRIHGTAEPWTIGTDVSSGCIRMVNDDVIDLYGRVAVGAKVVVL